MIPLAYDLFRAVFLLLTIRVIAVRPSSLAATRVANLAAIGLFAAWTAATWSLPYDFKRFWQVGADLRHGLDYYGLDPWGQRQLILNPPTVLPLFQAWSWLPLKLSAQVWTALNAVGVFLLTPAVHAVCRRQNPALRPLPRPVLALLASTVALSCATGMGLALGQVSLFAVFAIVLALWCQAASRPWLAGLCLALATIKVNTVLPFLILFTRRNDRPAWVALVLATLGLCAATGPLTDLPRRCKTTLQTIGQTFESGSVNDFTDQGDSHASLVGIDQAIHRLGIADRGVARGLAAIMLALALGGLAWQAQRPGQPPSIAMAHAALLSGVFFYHRVYDELILVIPCVYGTLQAFNLAGAQRRRAAICAILPLLAMYVSPDGLRLIHALTLDPSPPNMAIRAAIMPLCAWLILAGLAASLFAARVRIGTDAPSQPAPIRVDAAAPLPLQDPSPARRYPRGPVLTRRSTRRSSPSSGLETNTRTDTDRVRPGP